MSKFECFTVLLPSRWTWDVLCWGDRLSAGFADVLRHFSTSVHTFLTEIEFCFKSLEMAKSIKRNCEINLKIAKSSFYWVSNQNIAAKDFIKMNFNEVLKNRFNLRPRACRLQHKNLAQLEVGAVALCGAQKLFLYFFTKSIHFSHKGDFYGTILTRMHHTKFCSKFTS